MTKFFRDKNSFFIVLVISSLFAAMAIAVFAIRKGIEMWQQSGVVSTPSYYMRNLEKLKAAQPNDLVVCIRSNTPLKVERAVLVDQNNGELLSGFEIRHRYVEHIRKGGYTYDVFSGCEARIVKPPFSLEIIGWIVTHGFDHPEVLPNRKGQL
jgi:hypothetical protein